MPNLDIMIDIETYGTWPGAEIRSIGAVAFNHDGYVFHEDDEKSEVNHYLNVVHYVGASLEVNLLPPNGYENVRPPEPVPMIPMQTPPGFPTPAPLPSVPDVNPVLRTFRDPETVKWWNERSDVAKAAFSDPKPEPVLMAVGRLFQFIDHIKPVNVWGNSPTLDMALLEHYFRGLGFREPPWHFRSVRDVRTRLADADMSMRDYGDVPEFPPQRLHVAVDDARAQAIMVMLAGRKLHEIGLHGK